MWTHISRLMRDYHKYFWFHLKLKWFWSGIHTAFLFESHFQYLSTNPVSVLFFFPNLESVSWVSWHTPHYRNIRTPLRVLYNTKVRMWKTKSVPLHEARDYCGSLWLNVTGSGRSFNVNRLHHYIFAAMVWSLLTLDFEFSLFILQFLCYHNW